MTIREAKRWEPMLPLNTRARRGRDLSPKERAEVAEQWPEWPAAEIDEALWEAVDAVHRAAADEPALSQKTEPAPCDLDAIDARERRATAGPWEDAGGFNGGGVPTLFLKIPGHQQGGQVEMLEEDVEFITHARADVPALSAELRRLRARLEKDRAYRVAKRHIDDLMLFAELEADKEGKQIDETNSHWSELQEASLAATRAAEGLRAAGGEP